MSVSIKELITKSYSEFSNDYGMTQAAALAYYTVFSLPAILLVITYFAGVFFGNANVTGQIQTGAATALGGGTGPMLRAMIENASKHTSGGMIATVLGFASLIFAATTTFVQLQQSLNRMWEVKPIESGWKNFAQKRILSFFVLIGIGILVIVSIAGATLLSSLTRNGGLPFPSPLVYIVQIAVFWLIFAFLFGVIFKILPDAELSMKDVLVGAMITSGLFTIGKFLIGFYLGHSSTTSIYGAAGALALLLLWTYYSSVIFLFGAQVTQTWARMHGRPIRPQPGAVKFKEEGIRPSHGPQLAA